MNKEKCKAIMVRVPESDKKKIEQDARSVNRSVSNFLHWIWRVWHDHKEANHDTKTRESSS